MVSRLLTKSRFMNGLQCERLLWTIVNQPDAVPKTDVTTQHVFDQGYEVDELAHMLFPDGLDLSGESFRGNIDLTKKHLHDGKPLFQAGLMAGDLYSRVDVLFPTENGAWELVEVKSSTEVKPEYLPEVAFQRYCAQKVGLSVVKCSVIHVNNQYVRQGEINTRELLITEDVTELARGAALGLDETIKGILSVMGLSECPKSEISPRCYDPHDCPFAEECHSFLPKNNVLTLVRGKKTGYGLLTQGIQCIKDIPDTTKLTANQKIQRASILNDSPHIDRESIRAFLGELKYPLAYFDFETINPVIPLYDGMKPYQRIPFQFSLDVVPGEGARPQHFSFLAKTPDDPRPGLLAEMKKRMPDQGSVVVYNKTFEDGVLKELGAAFPDREGWLTGVRSRLLDLLEPFRKFHYYHPDQEGSASIKHVLPVLTGKGYEDMEIAAGDVASVLYWNVTHRPAADAERQKVYADLEKYCGLDTDGMRLIVDQLKSL